AALEATRAQRGLLQISTHELDLDHEPLPDVEADGAWSRWVLAFVQRPREALARAAARLKRGGVFVLHDYLDYGTWRLTPRSPELEEFVGVVMESGRAAGGEPDIGLDLPRWLEELGFEVRSLQPILDVVPATNFVWEWPKAFIEVGLQRLVDLGRMAPERARTVMQAFR